MKTKAKHHTKASNLTIILLLLCAAEYMGERAEAEIAVPEGFSAQTFAAGINGPTALVFGPGGAFGDDLFVAEGAFGGVGRILKIDRYGAISTFASSPLLEFPKGAAFDLSGSFSGDLFVSLDVYCPGPIPGSCTSGGVVRITPAGAVSYFLDAFATSPGLFGAFDLAFGPGGAFGDNLFLADTEVDSSSIGNILNVSPGGSLGSFVPFGSIKGASSLAFDRIGNFGGDLFVADPFTDPTFVDGTDRIMRVTPNGMVSQFASSPLLSNPTALAFDTVGHFGHDLFVLDAGANAIYRVDATGTVTPFATGFSLYIWDGNLAFGPSGDLFVADRLAGRIIRISAAPRCPNASFAEDAIVWHQPLARNGASEDSDPSAGRTVKYRFKRGSTIPVQIHALNCAGADVTSNANVIGKVAVFGDSNCDGAMDANATPIQFSGVGGEGGVMDKIGGHLKYNLNTKSLPATTQCYILRVTVTDTSTGEEKFEEVLLQAK